MWGRRVWLRALLVGLVAFGPGWDRAIGGYQERPVQELIRSVRVGRPLHHKALTIFPLSFSGPRDRTRYLTLDEAVRRGDLRIGELEGGRVNEVEVENTSKHYVFLMAGELLVGCKQDRMVSYDCLLPPQSGKLRLRVYCTEHGRWTAESARFKSPGEAVHLEMRQLAKETRSQDRVWAEVEEKRAELRVQASETQAFRKVLEDREVQKETKPYLDELGRVPHLGRDICGVVVAVNDRILVSDIFGSTELFEKLWAKLLRSYVLDVIGQPPGTGSVSIPEVESFLESALDAQYRRGDTDGVGIALEIESRPVFGSALLYHGNVVHVDLFPRERVPLREAPLDLNHRRQRLD